VKGFILSVAAGAIAFVLILQVLPATMIDFKPSGITPQLILVAVVVGLVNAVIKPIVKILSFPISLVTLGLSGFVINAALLMGVAYLAQNFAKLDLTIGGWPTSGITADTIVGAVVASALLSILSAVIGLVVRD
jgi:putative membrane protein